MRIRADWEGVVSTSTFVEVSRNVIEGRISLRIYAWVTKLPQSATQFGCFVGFLPQAFPHEVFGNNLDMLWVHAKPTFTGFLSSKFGCVSC